MTRGLSLSHEQDDHTGSDGAGEPSRGRLDEHDPEAVTDSAAPDADQHDDDSGVGAANGALGKTRDELDSAEEALDAEIVDDRPKKRIRSVISEWSGNLPHPNDAERYERIAPGTLDRLISLNERRLSVVEREVEISEKRAETIRVAVTAEADVKRSLADADAGAIRRGQWQLWSISILSIVAVITGLALGYPQALWGILVPIVQTGAALVRTVTQQHRGNDEPSGLRGHESAASTE
ncbi:hypothetical protein [Mycobacteroides abscessus]|uniref:hypothetical protein n=1 Tax=Mycobacteroides abscessus TaxID=36809 RepID=UPI001E472DA0